MILSLILIQLSNLSSIRNVNIFTKIEIKQENTLIQNVY